MKNWVILLTCVLSLFVSACGWKPDVSAVPVTEPWASMKLPVGTDTSIVFTSDPAEFRAVHKGDAKVSTAYIDSLKSQGWEMSNFQTSAEDSALVTADLSKGGEKMTLRAYMFDGSSTAVALELTK